MANKESKKSNAGRHSTLTNALAKLIIDDVRQYLSINFAAEAHNTPRSTVQSWIVRGNEDKANGIESDFSTFSQGIKKARAEYVQESLKMLKCMPKNWQATAWLLERCCAEDFGKDTELYKQLLEDYKMLMQSLVDQNKGVTHGR